MTMTPNLTNLLAQNQPAIAVESKQAFPWSKYQIPIFEAVRETRSNIAVEAVAGSGKTTTLLQMMEHTTGSNLFLAFNRSIITEIRNKVPMGVECKTFNALGNSLLPRSFWGKLDKWKMQNIVRELTSGEEYKVFGNAIVSMISSYKGAAMPLQTSAEGWEKVSHQHLDVPGDLAKRAGYIAQEAWKIALNTMSDGFTFDDQLYWPIANNYEFPKFDNVFIDEAQDLNTVKHMMVRRLADRGARIFAVGDTHQAIYAFAGALTNSMQMFKDEFECIEMPLSVCYRCDTNIVKAAKQFVPHIEPRSNADNGDVIISTEAPDPKLLPATGMVMCRTNAPIFSLARDFLKARVPCRVLSNFGPGLISFVRNFKVNTTDQLRGALLKWQDKEIASAEKNNVEFRIRGIKDKVACILPFCDEYSLKTQVVDALTRLLKSDNGTILCTIHKSKGLEADHAFLLRPDLLPAPWVDEGTEEFAQEQNLHYVAITRGKHSFTYFEDSDPGDV